MTRRKETAVSNEEIVAALLSSGTITAAASACRISTHTIYDRMKTREFKAAYCSAKNDVIRKAVYSLNECTFEAVTTLKSIMNNKDNNPAVRLQAAQTILNNANKFADVLKDREHTEEFFHKSPYDLSL